MRWLKREEGMSMVLVGVLLVVLLGLAGMAIDLGAVYAERRELRNGADAAVLAIAEDCGHQTRPCDSTTALATARVYANSNSHDGASGVDDGDLTLDTTARTARVVTHAVAMEGSTRLSGVRVPLMSLFGFDRVEVAAAATALWGYPGSGGGPPLIVGTCEYSTAVAGGQLGEASRVTLVFKGPSNDPEKPCPSDPAGKDAPGAFGWLSTDGTQCGVTVATWAPWPQTDPGASPSKGCDPEDLRALVGQDVIVPVYSDICGDPAGTECTDKDAGGSKTYYVVEGFASFRLESYSLGGQYKYPSGFSCPGGSSVRCISGYFTRETLSTGDATGQHYYGVVIVKLTE